MYAYFNIEEPTLLHILKMKARGRPQATARPRCSFQMGLADDVEEEVPLSGTLDFINNTVDPQTGTTWCAARSRIASRCPLAPPI